MSDKYWLLLVETKKRKLNENISDLKWMEDKECKKYIWNSFEIVNNYKWITLEMELMENTLSCNIFPIV